MRARLGAPSCTLTRGSDLDGKRPDGGDLYKGKKNIPNGEFKKDSDRKKIPFAWQGDIKKSDV